MNAPSANPAWLAELSQFHNESDGQAMHALASALFPIHRSITGAGIRQTLQRLQQELPELQLHGYASGTQVLDWIVPDEWRISSASLRDPNGRTVVDLATNNLHVLGYSEAVNKTLPLSALQAHLHSLPEQPELIPYVTSYYQRRWGFCLPHAQRLQLPDGDYHAHIEAEHFAGELNLADAVIAGSGDREVLISTYCCHPAMANNELSGPVVAIQLAKWLKTLSHRKHSYRFVFVPEMIGSIAYLSNHLTLLQERVIAGFNLSCIGDERAYSYLPTRLGNTLADRAALHALTHTDANFKRYHWRDRGSDESNYCAPGVDLPVASMMRSKYGSFPEYHTSADDLQLVTPAGLAGGLAVLKRAIATLELNCLPQAQVLGEPQLGRRGLYPSLSHKGSTNQVRELLDLISYADGKRDLLSIADELNSPIWQLAAYLPKLIETGVLSCD